MDSRSKNINNNYADDLDDQENELADPLENAIQTKLVPEILDHALTRLLQVELGSGGLEWNAAVCLKIDIFSYIYTTILRM